MSKLGLVAETPEIKNDQRAVDLGSPRLQGRGIPLKEIEALLSAT
jgi:hypothetical protein